MTTVIDRSAPTTEMPALASSPLGAYYFPYLLSAKDRFDQALLRYDAWYVVLVAVLLALDRPPSRYGCVVRNERSRQIHRTLEMGRVGIFSQHGMRALIHSND